MMHATKALSRVEIKDADKGEIAAVFSTFDEVDSDGDVTLKGAFTDGAPVAISAYGHMSWKGNLPVGHGQIRETSTEAVMEGRFFMDTAHGADTFRTVKAMSEAGLQEWSYSLDNIVSELGQKDGRRVRILKTIDVTEVSPVLKGAGVNTRTLSTKAKQLNSELYQALADAGREALSDDDLEVWIDDFDADDGWVVYQTYSDESSTLLRVDFERDSEGVVTLNGEPAEVERTTSYTPPKAHQFSEHIRSVVADVKRLHTRTSEVMALRAQKGKTLAPASVAELQALIGETEQIKALLDTPAPTHPDDALEALHREWLRDVARSTEGALL